MSRGLLGHRLDQTFVRETDAFAVGLDDVACPEDGGDAVLREAIASMGAMKPEDVHRVTAALPQWVNTANEGRVAGEGRRAVRGYHIYTMDMHSAAKFIVHDAGKTASWFEVPHVSPASNPASVRAVWERSCGSIPGRVMHTLFLNGQLSRAADVALDDGIKQQISQGWGLVVDDAGIRDALVAATRSGKNIVIYVNGQGNDRQGCEASVRELAARSGCHCLGVYNPSVVEKRPGLSGLTLDTIKSVLLKWNLIKPNAQKRLARLVGALNSWAGDHRLNQHSVTVDVVAHSQGALLASNAGAMLQRIPNVGLTTIGGAAWTIGGQWGKEEHHVFALDLIGLAGKAVTGIFRENTHFHWNWKGPLSHPAVNYFARISQDLQPDGHDDDNPTLVAVQRGTRDFGKVDHIDQTRTAYPIQA